MKKKISRTTFALITLTMMFVGAYMTTSFSPAAYAASTPCKAGYHRAGGKCVPTDKNHPVSKSDLNCAKNQNKVEIKKGKNKGKWYCEDKSGGGSGSGSGSGGGSSCSGSTCSPTPTGQGQNCDSNHCDLIALYINPLINLLSILVGLVVAASLVMAGIQYTSSSGDPQKIGAAKSRITNTLMAFLAYAFMYAFLNFLIPGGLF